MTYDKNSIIFQPLSTHKDFHDLTGRTFSRLTVLGFGGKLRPNAHNFWWCECICGTIKPVDAAAIATGHTQSCGCLHKEITSRHNATHGETRMGLRTPEFNAFYKAKQRCTQESNKDWDNYGGRGIEFRFESLGQFLAEIGRRPSAKHSLDRINNAGHYEPGNVRWATRQQQVENTRRKRIEQFTNKELMDEVVRRHLFIPS